MQHNVACTEAYLHAKFYPDPFSRLATIHQRYRQTGEDRQTDRQTDRQDRLRSDRIGRTVLQSVAQKLTHMSVIRIQVPDI